MKDRSPCLNRKNCNMLYKSCRKKYTESVSQETELQGCSIDGNLDLTESGAGDYARGFVKNPSSDGATSVKKLHKSLAIEVSCEAVRAWSSMPD